MAKATNKHKWDLTGYRNGVVEGKGSYRHLVMVRGYANKPSLPGLKSVNRRQYNELLGVYKKRLLESRNKMRNSKVSFADRSFYAGWVSIMGPVLARNK